MPRCPFYYYYLEAIPRTATAIERRIIGEVEALLPYPERIQESNRIPGRRERVVNKLPYVVFIPGCKRTQSSFST